MACNTQRNGTKAPIFDGIGIEYTASYVTSSYMYTYQYVGSGTKNVVAATIDWDETRPSGTSIRVNFGYTSSSTCTTGSTGVSQFTQANQTKTMTGTGYYMCLRVELTAPSSGAVTPTISNISIAKHSNAPSEPGIEINGKTVWSRAASAGALLGAFTVTQSTSSNTILKNFNDAIPDTGSGLSNISIGLSSTSSGILSLV